MPAKPQLKTVGIRDLKRNLSAYLREVRRGARLFVTDRGQIIAEVREPLGDALPAGTQHPIMVEWLAAETFHLPERPKERCPQSPVSLPKGTAQKILDDLRGE
jgi:hypothetical protein